MSSRINLKILVLGVGELGSAVLSALSAHPHRGQAEISVLLRYAKPALCDLLAGWRVSPLYADIATASVSSLAAVFKPFDVVIGCTGMVMPPGTQLKLVRAALEAKVTRYLPWQFGVDYDVIGKGSGQDLFDEQLDVRALLRGQQDVRWVVVSTGCFMPFLFEESFGVVIGLKEPIVKVRPLGSKEVKVTVTTVEDIGRVVAEAVFSAPETQGVIFTSGQTVAYGELTNILRDVLKDKSIKDEEWTVDQLEMELSEKPDDGMRKYRLVFAAGKGVSWDEKDTWDKHHGLQLTGLREWVERNLSAT